jgi:hypothetical protein
MQMKLLMIINADFDSTSATDQISYFGQILEKKWEFNGSVLELFIDLKKAYNILWMEVLYNILFEF